MKDRFGEEPDEVSTEVATSHDPQCRNGWLGEDLDGRMVPCLVCKPHLLKQFDYIEGLIR